MIVKNKNLDIPHGNTVIWRYVGLDKFLDLLISQELFFSNAAKMSDKYEGLIPKRNQDYLLKSIKIETLIAFFEKTDPVLGALYATLFTWGLTAFGASFVFFFKKMNCLFY